MRKHRPVVLTTSLLLGLALTAVAFLGCSPEHIDDTANVTLRFSAGDAGAVGFQCVEPKGSVVCDALHNCTTSTQDVRTCLAAECKGPAAGCDPGLVKCLAAATAAGTGTPDSRAAAVQCLENACSVPLLSPAKTIAIVLDYVRLDGVPSCLPNYLQAWCDDKRGTPGVCRPLPNRRRCIEVTLPQPISTSVTGQAVELSKKVVDAISSAPLLDADAPNDQTVIVRVAAIEVAGGCAALTDTTTSLVDPGRKVVGCARSCPVTLNVSQDVAIDFEDPTCTHLRDCADFTARSSAAK